MSHRTIRRRARFRRVVTALCAAAALTGTGLAGLSAPAHAVLPSSTLRGLATLPDGTPVPAKGVLLAVGADPSAYAAVGDIAAPATGLWGIEVPATDALVSLAETNGGHLSLIVGLAHVATDGATQTVYRAEETLDARLAYQPSASLGEPKPVFHVPDPQQYVLSVDDAVGPTTVGTGDDTTGVSLSAGDGEAVLSHSVAYSFSDVVVLDPVSGQTVLDEAGAGEVTKNVQYARDGVAVVDEVLAAERLASQSVDGAAAMASKGCVMNGSELSKKNIQAYPPKHTPASWSSEGMDIGYTFHMYVSGFARTLVGYGPTWQVERCTAGGAKTASGWRLKMVGSGDTNVHDRTTVLHYDWSKGTDESIMDAKVEMNVAATNDLVGISGSVSQKATGINKGSVHARGPIRDYRMDRYKHNQVTALWTAVCAAYANPRTCGSRDFQGTVSQALYEFPRSENTQEVIGGVYYLRHCTTWNYQCPN